MKRRITSVFTNGNSVAVRLVGDCRLPTGTPICEYRDGERIILQPMHQWPKSFIEALGKWKEEIPQPQVEKKQRDPLG